MARHRPAYLDLADRLRAAIEAGEYGPGDLLPSEAALATRHRLARGTVRAAIAELVTEGAVISRTGAGHFVRPTPVRLIWLATSPEDGGDSEAVTPGDSWSRSVRAQGHEPSERIGVEIILADPPAAELLAVVPGEPLCVRRRVRYVDGAPYAIADSFYPRSIVAGSPIELPSDVAPGTFAIFEQLGRGWRRTTDRVRSRQPTPQESDLLAITHGTVTEIARRSFDTDGIPVRLTIFVLPDDRHEVEYVLMEVKCDGNTDKPRGAGGRGRRAR